MVKAFCAVLVFACLAACTPAAPVDSGVQGYVSAGPSCPISRPEAPCPDMAYAGTLTILAERDRKRVTSITADAEGYYKVFLPAGNYIIHPESPGVLPRGSEVVVQVQPHQFTRQDISYDTGIR